MADHVMHEHRSISPTWQNAFHFNYICVRMECVAVCGVFLRFASRTFRV